MASKSIEPKCLFFFSSASTSSLSFWTNPTTFGSWDVEEKVCPDVSESIPNVLAIAIHIYLSYCLFVSKKGKVNINNLKMPLITFFLMLQWRPFEFECSKQTDCYRPSVSPSSTFTCVHDFPSRKKAHKVQMQQTHTHTSRWLLMVPLFDEAWGLFVGPDSTRPINHERERLSPSQTEKK